MPTEFCARENGTTKIRMIATAVMNRLISSASVVFLCVTLCSLWLLFAKTLNHRGHRVAQRNLEARECLVNSGIRRRFDISTVRNHLGGSSGNPQVALIAGGNFCSTQF